SFMSRLQDLPSIFSNSTLFDQSEHILVNSIE
ncbi:hypothetical protein A2U01_0101813, partial [Trifolium medium]|nr:hypothetical protein [Trifolium medium]